MVTTTKPRKGWRRDRPVVVPPRPKSAPRLLFINQYYWPDNASTGQHLTDLAEDLAQRGHECHVLCGRGAYVAGGARPPARETRNGVVIHRVAATSFGRKSTIGRMADYLSFYANAAVKALALPRPDVVVTLTTPPIIGLVGTALKFFKGAKHVNWSMDLHPDASFALGKASPRSPIMRGLAALSDWVVRRADRTVALGPYMAARVLAKGARPERVVEVPVWSRSDEVRPRPRAGHPFRAELGLADKFVAMYSGNLGLAHSFDEFLHAARDLRDRDDFVFLFVGGGPRLKEVRDAKERDALTNVRILDYVPRERLHESLTVADVHLISMRPEATGIVVPGKLYGIMASGRPALFVGPTRCESADTVREADCGLVVPYGDGPGVAGALRWLADDPEAREAMGRRGRAAFLRDHEQTVCCAQWAEVLGDLVGRPQVVETARPSPSLMAAPV